MSRAAELGVRAVVLDGPGSWAADLAADGLIERFVPIDFRNAAGAFEACKEAVSAVQQVHRPQKSNQIKFS